VPFDVIGDLDLEASHQHPQRPRRDQLIERTGQVIAVSVIGDYLQHQAYSFPAGQHQRNPQLGFGRVRRPLTRTWSSTTFGYRSTHSAIRVKVTGLAAVVAVAGVR
jgi:hypothetical protein